MNMNLFDIARELQEESVKFGRMNWAYYTTGFDFGIQEQYTKMTDILKRKDYFEFIRKTKDNASDPLEKRRAELIYDNFEPFHQSDEMNRINVEIRKITNRLSGILNTSRSTIDGREVTSLEITEILSGEPDRELRKKAYFSRNQVNKPLIDGGFIDLINLRKEYAKAAGKKDFVDYSLERNELSTDLFDTWTDTVKGQREERDITREEFAKEYLNDDTVYPWDEGYIRSSIAPLMNKKVNMAGYYDSLTSFFASFGFDISKYNITYDLFSRKNKSEWGYNFPLETARDSRILANIQGRYYEFGVLLHETGHALHSFLNDPEKLILNSGISGIIAEGIANLFGSFLTKPLFYEKYFGEELKEAERQFKALERWSKANVFSPVASIFFDQQLYREKIESHDDILALNQRISGDLFGAEAPDQETPWGYRIHHTTHPIYLHNYFMGDVTCEMLKKVFSKKEGIKKITDKPEAFGTFLYEEVIKPSGIYPYPELFKRISGKEFSLSFITD